MIKRLLVFAMFLLGALPLRAQTITVQPTNQTVTVGQTATFSVSFTGGPCRTLWKTGAVGNKWGAYSTSPITFSIANTTLAMNGTTVQVELFGCSGGALDVFSTLATLTVQPAAITLQSLAITPAAPVVAVAAVEALTLTGTFSDGSTQDLSGSATWSSDTPTVASVSGNVVTGVSRGSAKISATSAGVTTFVVLIVQPVITVSLNITNTDATIPPIELMLLQVVTNPGTNPPTTTSTTVLDIKTDATGKAVGTFLFDKTQLYDIVLFVNNVRMDDQYIPGPLFDQSHPTFTTFSKTAVLYPGTATAELDEVLIK